MIWQFLILLVSADGPAAFPPTRPEFDAIAVRVSAVEDRLATLEARAGVPTPKATRNPTLPLALVKTQASGSTVTITFPYLPTVPGERVVGEVVAAPQSFNANDYSVSVVPPGMHAHRRTDGTVIVHGDENFGDPVAHAGVARPWPKVAVSGQMISYGSSYSSDDCPGGVCPSERRGLFGRKNKKK